MDLSNKNFIVGLSMMKFFGSFEDLKLLCSTYNNNILSWYISPPFGLNYQSRQKTLSIENLKNIIEISDQISTIKLYNQLLQLALNASNLKLLNNEIILKDYQKWLNFFCIPDSIVLLDELIPYFLKFNIPLTYSYNNYYPKTKFKNLQYCTHIVLGNKDIRNLKFMENILNKYQNIKIELLLNNGCHFLCNKECNNCYILQNKRLQKISYEEALAEQSLLPSELKLYPNGLIDLYKISSRPCNYNDLNLILNFYTKQISLEQIQKQIDLSKPENWRFFCRLNPILSQAPNNIINVEKVIDYKYKIWKNILNTNNFLI